MLVLIEYAISPSVAPSSTPLTVTVCAVLQLLEVKVRVCVVAPDANTPSVASLMVKVNTTSCLGALVSTTP